jgi:hypothetical protein
VSVARVAPLLLSTLAIGCTAAAEPIAPATENVVAAIAPPEAPPPPARFTIDGKLMQGGWLLGQAPAGTTRVALDGQPLELDADGRFFVGFDHDAGASAVLTATLANGSTVTDPIAIAPRAWGESHLGIPMRQGGPSEAFMAIRRPELAQIAAARNVSHDVDGWKQHFIWPVTGRISDAFGVRRFYRGVEGSYHSGLDISTGTSGTPYVAPADGVVVLAVQGFSLEGNLLIIDHGNGLNSAFLHSSRLYVKTGDVVKQGQHIGDIGMSGRATGPHLHWSLKWHDARLDPLLFTGPMP